MKRIWVVEDEPDIAELLAHNLRRERFIVRTFHDGEEFLTALEGGTPDLVILDLMLPGIDGLEICKMMREDERRRSIPIIILTAKGGETDVVLGLELGADDYVVKPFSIRELIARVKAVLRRVESPSRSVPFKVEGLQVDPEGFSASVDGTPLDLTFAEFRLLSLLISKPGRVFTRRQIIDWIWEGEKVVLPKAVDVHVSNLRRKLGRYGGLIKSVRGVGYKFEVKT
ncbi:TPA: response regulator transcription factor [Candidatus Poribacteria bacterium]|nr:response regulator transcription factor [Candidatus Poribacteria bacterium]